MSYYYQCHHCYASTTVMLPLYKNDVCCFQTTQQAVAQRTSLQNAVTQTEQLVATVNQTATTVTGSIWRTGNSSHSVLQQALSYQEIIQNIPVSLIDNSGLMATLTTLRADSTQLASAVISLSLYKLCIVCVYIMDMLICLFVDEILLLCCHCWSIIKKGSQWRLIYTVKAR